jgi:hypothetical protein
MRSLLQFCRPWLCEWLQSSVMSGCRCHGVSGWRPSYGRTLFRVRECSSSVSPRLLPLARCGPATLVTACEQSRAIDEGPGSPPGRARSSRSGAQGNRQSIRPCIGLLPGGWRLGAQFQGRRRLLFPDCPRCCAAGAQPAAQAPPPAPVPTPIPAPTPAASPTSPASSIGTSNVGQSCRRSIQLLHAQMSISRFATLLASWQSAQRSLLSPGCHRARCQMSTARSTLSLSAAWGTTDLHDSMLPLTTQQSDCQPNHHLPNHPLNHPAGDLHCTAPSSPRRRCHR